MTDDMSKMTRGEAAQREMSLTSVSPALAVVMTAVFLAIVYSVPVIQYADELLQRARGLRSTKIPSCLEFGGTLKETARVYSEADGSLRARMFAANRYLLPEIKRYERKLEEDAWLTRLLLPRTQLFMTRCLGTGNEKVYPGIHGWLFYRPDVDYVTGRGFLEPAQMKRRIASRPEWEAVLQPDPVRAIVDFDRELKARGIRLIVMPVPVKPSIHPAELYGGVGKSGKSVQNPSYGDFIERLHTANVFVFDCSEMLRERYIKTGEPQYLAYDTHWRPDAMEFVAEQLAGFVRDNGLLPEREPILYRRDCVNVTTLGDIAAILKLPEGQRLYPPESVTISRVLAPDVSLWTRRANSDVLVLGDSFCNIFSMQSLGWGMSAGLAEQISFFLQRPVDRITMNDNGAFATRQELARELSQNPAKLDGKKVVIWQFAARELASGNWLTIPLAETSSHKNHY